jgi:copper homeostasis protein
MVMIRPRGGDFCYTNDEFEIMREDIRICRELGAAGVVFGLLNHDHSIDIERTSELVNLAHPLMVTFHKAIDSAKDILQSVEQLKTIGVDRILSSGGQTTAIEGCEILCKMIEIAGDQLKIIVAGKVTWENFDEVTRLIPAREYHGRKLVKF